MTHSCSSIRIDLAGIMFCLAIITGTTLPAAKDNDSTIFNAV